MGLLGSLEWMNNYGKRRCRSLFCRVRAKVKKALRDRAKHKKQLRFQYDPSSYALNFDDGSFHSDPGSGDSGVQEFYTQVNNNTTWVYVVWVKTK
ncbi:putative Glucose-fructose oxidoreductase domain-containing protein 2 [Senna tora]|uniref:Putative Glucose-fructose oxidoreductase domain-containing protein 2 n=1 Tax=Senna tora TaxID=362788 RepID=A0A834SHI4_9FABA|nr:putative Glucose-fructose oxidoreductase domain-containing protein 2 [Senna tora]